jgi:hypothetical protein
VEASFNHQSDPNPQSYIGIAVGTGTDVAMESAGVTLVKGEVIMASGLLYCWFFLPKTRCPMWR